MNRLLFLSLLLFFFLTNIFGQFITELNSNTPIETGDIANTSLIRNYKGELFLFYYKNNTLCVQKSTDNGQSFSEYDPGLGSYGFTAIRDVAFFNRTVSRQHIFFIGTKNNKEGIYYLALDEEGVPVLARENSLDIEYVEGSIELYKPYYTGGGAFCILYIKGTSFGYTFINSSDTEIIKNIVHESGPVVDFDFQGIFVNNTLRECGTYTIDDGYIQSLYYFEYSRGKSVFNNMVAQDITNTESRFIINKNGLRCVVFLNDNNLYAQKMINGEWRTFNNGEPVSGNVQGTIVSFVPYLVDDLLFIVFGSMYNGDEFIYISKCKENEACTILNNGNPLSLEASAGKPFISYSFGRSILIAFLYGEEKEIWCKKYRIDDESWENMESQVAGTGVYEEIKSYIFYHLYNDISLIEKADTDYQFTSYVYKYKTGGLHKLSSVPLFQDALSSYSLKLLNENVICLYNESKTQFIDCMNGIYEIIEDSICNEIETSLKDSGFFSIKKNDQLYLYKYTVQK